MLLNFSFRVLPKRNGLFEQAKIKMSNSYLLMTNNVGQLFLPHNKKNQIFGSVSVCPQAQTIPDQKNSNRYTAEKTENDEKREMVP
ncbi:hypothetical protein [Chitinophaga tropicalis]|uniref:Uncharacterized protein n=1 Tax=Chitinophaga tropicalis TaxID=2683588 RepID=A0A7K1U4T8_9BACT|nr:hypothetical protein [Chitinophaga tropicalis]MVT09350.1 hypothetical protein [Chitinophaga tropicalis]